MTVATSAKGQTPALTLPVAAAGIGALLLWSGTSTFTKLGTYEIDPITVGLLRSAIAAVLALVIARLARLPFPPDLKSRLILAYAGVTSFCLWPGILSLGIGYTSASHSLFIIALIPVFTGLIANILERRMPVAGWWLGVVVALAGTGYLITLKTPEGSDLRNSSSVTGDLIIFAGAAICASGYVAGGKLTPKFGTWSTTFWGLGIALIPLIPLLAILAPLTDWSSVGIVGWGSIAYMTFGSSLAGYALWFWALGQGGIARIGSWQFGMPVAGVTIAALVLGEILTWELALAGAVILVGTFIAQRNAK
jgi:drug/metabolite transporter (DMT)-like permease